jgi:hypothetical protein
MSTIDLVDLQRRVAENVAALYAGEDLPHQFTEEESLALRPKHSPPFGLQPDGQIRHCGNVLADRTELEINLLNDSMRIEAGFLPKNSPEEIQKMMRAEAYLKQKTQEASDRQSFRIRVLGLVVVLTVFCWLFIR